MRIAVLGGSANWYLRDLKRAAKDRHQVEPVAFTRVHATLGKRAMIGSDHQSLTDFDAVLVRTMPAGSLEQVVFRMDALAALESAGSIVVNPANSLEIAIDKFLALSRLQGAGFEVPETFVCQSLADVARATEILGDDEVVAKPIFGGEGRRVRRIKLTKAATELSKMAERGEVFYLQRFIPHDGRDYRLFVVGDRVLGMQRVNPHNWRTNISLGAIGKPLEITTNLSEMALRAAASVGASVCALDLLPAKDGRLVALEVNAVPGWRALSETTGEDVAGWVLAHVESLARSAGR